MMRNEEQTRKKTRSDFKREKKNRKNLFSLRRCLASSPKIQDSYKNNAHKNTHTHTRKKKQNHKKSRIQKVDSKISRSRGCWCLDTLRGRRLYSPNFIHTIFPPYSLLIHVHRLSCVSLNFLFNYSEKRSLCNEMKPKFRLRGMMSRWVRDWRILGMSRKCFGII